MNKIILILSIFFFIVDSSAQSKKEQIDILNTRIDSLQSILLTERSNYKIADQKLEKSKQKLEQESESNAALQNHIIKLGQAINVLKKDKQTNQLKIKELRDSIQSLKGTLELCGLITEPKTISSTKSGCAILLTDLKRTPAGFFLKGSPYTGAVFNAPYRDTLMYGMFKNGLKHGLWMESVHSQLKFTQFLFGKKQGPYFILDLKIKDSFIKIYELFNSVSDIKSLVLLIHQYKFYVHHIELTSYSEDRKNGQHISYRHNSDNYYFNVEIGNYKNGKKQGTWYNAYNVTMKNWNGYSIPETPNTGNFVISNYNEDKKNGVTEKHQSGVLKERIRYKDDNYDGDYERYDSSANLISITKYKDGREIRN